MNACMLRGAELREHDMDRLCQQIAELPRDRAYTVRWEESKHQRSLAQNAYLFGVAYARLSDVTGYEKQDIHEYLLGLHFGTKLKRVPKTKRNLEGLIEVPVRTTTTDEHGRRSVLGKADFAEYVDFVIRFAARHGIHVPPPDPDYRHMGDTA